MIKVGLTGNIGSGKSTVARLFEILEVPVFYADQQARVISERKEVIEEIRSAFGSVVVDQHGRLNRKELASIVFNSAEKLSSLNEIIHPRVISDFTEWCKLYNSFPYILHESAILFESGLTYLCDKVIVVSAPKELRLKRVMLRDRLSNNEVLVRMSLQWTESELLKLSDFEVVNDDCLSLIEQVKIIDASLNSDIL